MPIWQPPTPPRDENDLYLDHSLTLWYNTSMTMAESELPPIYVKKESNKRIKIEPSVISGTPEPTPSLRGATKIKREETTSAPRSLFDWRDLKKDMKLHKYPGLVRPSLGALKQQQFIGKPSDPEPLTEWLIHEDWNIVQAIQQILQLPLNLSVLSHGHTPNWDLVGDLVNSFSVCYRSQRQCKNRYENTLVFREENKEGIVQENITKKISKKNKGFGTPGRPSSASRGLGTFQLFQQDNNSKYSSLYGTRFETIKSITVKKTPTMKPMHVNPASKNSKHAQILSEHGIQYDDPLTPSQVAANRAERLQREKKTQAELVQQQQTRLQMQSHQSQPQGQITTVNQLHRQLQQVHQAHPIVQQQQPQHVAVVAAGTSSAQQQQPVVVSTGGITGKMATSVVLNQGLGTNLVSVSGSIVSSGVTTIVTTSTSVPTTATATILSGVRTAVANQTAPTCRTAFTLQGTTQATVVSVASLAQLQTAKLTASLTSQATQQRGITGVPVQTRTIMPQQLPYLRQAQRQTLAFQPGKVVATSTTGDQQTIKRVQIAGQSSTGQKVQVAVSGGTVPGITAIQMVKPGTMVATAGTSGASANQAKTRTFSESEMNALLRRQPQQIAHAKARGIAQVLKQRSLVGMKGATVGVQLGSKTGTVQILQGPTQKHLTVQQYQLLKQVQQQQQQQPQIIQQGTVVAKAIATGASSSGNNNGGITQAALTSQATKLIPVTVSTQQQPIKQTIQVVSAGSSVVGGTGSSGLRVSSGERATGITLQGSAVRVANPTLLSLGSAALQGQPVSVAVRTPSSNSVRIQTTTLPSHQQTTTTIATTQQQQQPSSATASPQ